MNVSCQDPLGYPSPSHQDLILIGAQMGCMSVQLGDKSDGKIGLMHSSTQREGRGEDRLIGI